MKASTYVLAAVLPINIALNYYLVWKPSTALGFKGAPIAVSITYWCMLLFLILYIKYVEGSKAWGGFSKRCFQDWDPYFKLGIFI